MAEKCMIMYLIYLSKIIESLLFLILKKDLEGKKKRLNLGHFNLHRSIYLTCNEKVKKIINMVNTEYCILSTIAVKI